MLLSFLLLVFLSPIPLPLPTSCSVLLSSFLSTTSLHFFPYFLPPSLSLSHSLPGTPKQGPSRDISSFMQAQPTRARLTMLSRNSFLPRMEYTVPHCVCWHMKFINGLTRGASPVICLLAKRDSLLVERLKLPPTIWPALLKWQILTHTVRVCHLYVYIL